MPSFGFKGFTTGSPVALSVAQGVNTESRTIERWGQNVANVGILTVTAPVVTAPAGVWFEAIDIAGFDVPGGPGPGEAYDRSMHDITYVWTVRGTPLPAFTAPGNMVAAWNDANIAYGKKVMFFFPGPGSYTVDLWCVDRSGTTATAETTVEVISADSHYSGIKTICFSDEPGETWDGETPGCQRARSEADIGAALATATTPPRLLFKRGSDTAITEIRVDTELLGHIGAWGTGPDPIIRPAAGTPFVIWNDAAMTQLTIDSIDFRGPWDTTTEHGISPNPFTWAASPTSCHYQIWNCSFDGFGRIDVTTTAPNSRIMMGNCIITNWQDYGFLINTEDQTVGMAGLRIAQHVDALHGGPKVGGIHNNHGPLRLSWAENVYLGCCDLFSRTGWSGASGDDRADQPCIRGNAGGTAGVYRNFDRVVCEGGTGAIIVMDGSNTGTPEHPGNYIFDRMLLIGTGKSKSAFISAQMGGLTLRNSLMVLPNVAQRVSGGWAAAIEMNADNPQPGNIDAPMQIYSNTILVLRDTATDPELNYATIVDNQYPFTNVTAENNVLHAPDTDTPVTDHAPIDLSVALQGVSPRFKGVRYNFRYQAGIFAADVPPAGTLSVPYSEITEQTWGDANTTPTNQAYWQATETTDTRHVIVADGQTLRAEAGEISVSFGATEATITNLSGTTWPAEKKWTLRLDRTSRIPAMDENFSSFGQTIPLPRPLPTSPAVGAAALGYVTRFDALGTARSDPPSSGAVEPV